MQCQFEALEARRALSAASRAVASKKAPILDTVLIQLRDNTAIVTGTNMDLQVSGTFPCEHSGWARLCLDASQFSAFLSRVSGRVKLSYEDGPRATLTSGRSRALIPVLPSDEFPMMATPPTGNVTCDGDKLAAALKAVAPHVAHGRHTLDGVFLDHDKLVATDGVTLALAPLSVQVDKAVVLSVETADMIAALISGDAVIGLSDSVISVSTPEITVVSKLLDGGYPDWQRVVPSYHEQHAFQIDRESLVDALEAANALGTVQKEGATWIGLDIADCDMTVSRSESDVPKGGELEVSIPLIQPRAEPIRIALNGIKLLRCLKSVTGMVDMCISGAGDPILIRGDKSSVTCVIMPRRGV